MDLMDDNACQICQKHRGDGPLIGPIIYAAALVVVSHHPTMDLGYSFVETRRHVAALDQLTEAEIVAVARATRVLARALRSELKISSIHTFVAGLGVPHFHQHVFVRHEGTPVDQPWWPVWPDAPHGDGAELSRRLATYFEPSAPTE